MKLITHNSKIPWYERIMLITIVIICLYVGLNYLYSTGFYFLLDKDYIDSYGSFIGGVGALCGIYYLYKTLKSQNEAQKLSSFETRYIQLISFNRNMMNDIKIETNSRTIQGKECFQTVIYLFKQAFEIVENTIGSLPIENLYKDKESFNRAKEIWGTTEKLKMRTIINFSYLITFIGVKETALQQLRFILNKNYNIEFVDQVIYTFQLYIDEPSTKASQDMNPIEKLKNRNNNNKLFKGFQHEFGNYYRLLFQIFRYLNDQSWISSNDQYTYAKMLRSQLSNYEELLLFFNSLSDYGLDWEYNKKQDKEKLITKYKLIKNIPFDQSLAKMFYPEIIFESE